MQLRRGETQFSREAIEKEDFGRQSLDAEPWWRKGASQEDRSQSEYRVLLEPLRSQGSTVGG